MLGASEEKYRFLVENANDLIIIAQDGVIKFSNQKAREFLGYTEQELHGLPFAGFIHPEDRDIVINRHKQRLTGENPPDTYNFRITNRKGEAFWIEISSVVIEWLKKPATINFLRDISERKKLEDQLRQAQKMESIGTLAGGIAHDFNNILYIIIGNTDIGMEALPDDCNTWINLNEIRIAADRAKNMIKQILTFSRQTDPEKKPVKVQSILKEVINLLKSSIPAIIEIRKNIDDNCSHVLADSIQVHQVVMNLSTNAYHAMRETGGILEFTLQEENISPENRDTIPELHPGTYAKLMVSDTGQGIQKEILDKIFDPFFTTKPPGEGTGMGLSVVHGIIKSHNGDIKVYSQPGQGTTFVIYLPVIGAEAGNEKTVPYEPVQTGNERIFFVEDEKQIISIIHPNLEQLGYQVTSFSNSVDALETFKSNPDKFDVVITDLNMPFMTGMDLASGILKARPDIPVILCTGYSYLLDEEKAKAVGIKELLLKPIEKQKLAYTIRKVLDNKK